MLSDEKLMAIINAWLESSPESGEKAGGSGHLSYVSFSVDRIVKKEKTEEGWIVDFEYTQHIETEFTYYPDNPPYKYPFSKRVLVKENGEVVEL